MPALSLETRLKISQALRGRQFSEEHRLNISKARKGHNCGVPCRKCGRVHPMPPTSMKGHNWGECRKCGKTHIHATKGKPLSPEHKKKISEAMKKRIFSREHRRKISKALTGKTLSLETREKISKALQGRILTAQHKAKLAKHNRSLRMRMLVSEVNSRIQLKKMIAQVRKFYSLSEEDLFYPVTLYEHKFARKVLIEGRSCGGFFSHHGRRDIVEQPPDMRTHMDGYHNIHALSGELL